MSRQSKLGFNETWSMAVGGMVGGGIFSTLGVVVVIAGAWAWLSFVAAGLVALAAGYSYVKLAGHYGEGGGAFVFLREINRLGFAGSLSWVLIVGYVLTNSVYALTFGEYLGNVIGVGPWFPRPAGVYRVVYRPVRVHGGDERFCASDSVDVYRPAFATSPSNRVAASALIPGRRC